MTMEENIIMRKKLRLIETLAICFILTGCGHEHTWIEATCTEPKTCSECGETEGEALGHTWAEATCAEPKTCSICGETEGKTLAHTWVEATCAEPKHCSVCGETEGKTLEHTLTEANYQQAATCEVCGESVGEPLQADFEKYGLVCNAKVDTPITFFVPDYDTNELTARSEVTFSDYKIFQSDDKHKAVDGYEWRAVTATAISQNGKLAWTGSDYYNVAAFDNYEEHEIGCAYTVNYNGIDYTECYTDYEEMQNEWNRDVLAVQCRFFFLVPIGYDGRIIYFYNYNNTENGNYINDLADENAVIFRLQ